MNQNKDYDEIRRLLALFYDGSSTRAEEQTLGSLLREARQLPEDLEPDRRLFLTLHTPSDEMPAEVSQRIADALDLEFEASRTATHTPDGTLRHRRIWLYSGIAAACIAAVWIFSAILIDNGNTTVGTPAPAPAVLTANVDRASAPLDTTAAMPLTACAAKPSVAPSHKSSVPVPALTVEETAEDTDEYADPTDDTRVSLSEEELRMAKNYNVIDNRQEAYAIINAVFSSINSNMDDCTRRVSCIENDYRMQTVKL